jgi:hypothetical protein
MFVTFHRAVCPDGFSLDFDKYLGLDQIGTSGLATKVAVVLTIALVATSTGRNALAWIYLQSTDAIERSVHFPFPLDRLDPTCPQCM